MSARIKVFHRLLPSLVRKQSVDQRVKIANEIADSARGMAPVLTGKYRGGIGVRVSGDSVMVVDEDEDAIHKEYGTSDTPAHAAMTSAASAYGTYSGMRPRS